MYAQTQALIIFPSEWFIHFPHEPCFVFHREIIFLLTVFILISADETEGGATAPSNNGIGQEKDNVTLESKLWGFWLDKQKKAKY